VVNPILQTIALVKRFPGVVALNGVSLDVRPGEIHAICGENGAGKSTLIKVLSGIHPHASYEGLLQVDGKPAHFHSVADARRAGIAVIPQELALVGELTVAENLFLGVEPRSALGLIDHPRLRADAAVLLRRFDIHLDPATPVSSLGVAHRQLIEIAKAAGRECRVLILDEPTAALAGHEVALLLDRLRDLRSRGIACVYISHRLDEVFAIADRITVLRDGATVAALTRADTSPAEVIRHMVGRPIDQLYPRDPPPPGDTALTVRGLCVEHPQTGKPFLHDISFRVRAGEVLGIGGLMGAGRTELLMHLLGAWGRRTAGEVLLGEQPLPPDGPAASLHAGLALVTEDRRHNGLVLEEGVGFNLSLSSLDRIAPRGWIDASEEARRNLDMFARLGVRATGLGAVTGRLSGGNQQKVAVGKALLAQPRVLLLDEPTRGIDVGAKQEMYALINELTRAGLAVVLVSSELPELMGLSDRILILREGRCGGQCTRAEATPERLMEAAVLGSATTSTLPQESTA
jgi:D-xylose transport system ATP-binding protein